MSKLKGAAAPAERHFVTALARGLDLLRCFDQPGLTLTVSELARRVGLSQPTVWRLAYTLLDRGYLTRAPDGAGLRIGVPALTLGYAAIQGLDLPELAHPYMRQITDRMRGTTTLSFRQGVEMISVRRCDGDFVRPNQPVGWRAPIVTVPSGLAIIAALPPEQRAATMAELRAREPMRWPGIAAKVQAACEAHARDGYVLNAAMMKGQYSAVAVPLVGDAPQPSRTAWALSCGGLASVWTDGRLHSAGRELLRVKALLQPALACAGAVSS